VRMLPNVRLTTCFENCPKGNHYLDISQLKHLAFGIYFNVIYLNRICELQQKMDLQRSWEYLCGTKISIV
jgi:NAD-dependent dihydropyrimidine dehydrogenase PreA subunit